jgi:biopolymer transport protein ExbD
MSIKSFDREDLHAPMADINTTPLVDVLLVLLVIFLVAAPVLNHAIKLELPAQNNKPLIEKNSATISIDAKGKYYWNDQAVSSGEIEHHLDELAKNNSDQPIYIRADTEAAYGKVSQILGLIAKEGLTNVRFVTKPDKN